MELTDVQLKYFVDNRLKLPKGKRTEYLAQVDNLIEELAKAAKDDDVINIKKFLKTGSLRKGTVLRPKAISASTPMLPSTSTARASPPTTSTISMSAFGGC